MRDILTIIAALIVVVLCAALAVPYFVDWEARRGDVELALSRALGLPVMTQGDINLRLLPTPRVVLGKVVIGTPAAGQPGITANALSVELETTALLSGAIRVIEANFTRPVVTVIARDDGSLTLPELSTSIPMPVSTFGIEKLAIHGGELRIIETSGGVRAIGPISVEMQAATLAGPWRIAGLVGNVPVRLSTGTIDTQGRLRIKGGVGDATGPHLDIDGDLSLAMRGTGTGRELAPTYNGRLGVVVPLPRDAAPAAVPATDGAAAPAAAAAELPPALTASATVTTTGRRIKAETVEIANANGGSGLALTGTGELDLGRDGPSLTLALASRRLEIGQGDGLAKRMGAVGETLVATLPGLRTTVTLQAASFAIAGEEFGPLEAGFGRDAGKVTVERFNLAGPGEARLEAAGSLGFGAATEFSGRVQFGVREPARLALSLGRIGLPPQLAQALGGLPASRLAADLSLSPAVLAARNIRFTAGDASLSGLFRYTPANGAERARFDAQLAGKGLDLASLPLFDSGLGGLTVADLGLAVDLEAPRFGTIASPSGRLRARLTSDAQALTIESAEMTNVDGANMKLAGRLGREGGQISGNLTAPRPAVVAALAARFLPPSFAESLRRVAPLAAPLSLAVKAERRDARAPVIATLDGQGGGTTFHVALSLPTVAGTASPPQGADASVKVELSARDGVDLLRQLGADVLPVPGTGGGRLVVDLTGPSLAYLAGRAELQVAGASLVATGRLGGPAQPGEEPPLAQGRVTLGSDDLSGLAQVLARSFPGLQPGMAARLEADGRLTAQGAVFSGLSGHVAGSPVEGRMTITGEGHVDGALAVPRLALADLAALALGPVPPASRGQLWPSQRFVQASPPVLGKVALTFGQLDIAEGKALTDGRVTLELASDAVTLRDVTGRFGGGTVQALLKLQRQGTLAALTGHVAVQDVAQAALIGEGLAGTLTGRIEAGSSGESVAALVTNLSGGGEVRARDSALARLDPAAITRGLARLLARDQIRAEANAVRDEIAGELDKANWAIADVSLPLTLSGGTLRFGPVAIDNPDATLRLAGTLDLGPLSLDARGLIIARQLPRGWSGAAPEIAVTWRGPLAAPVRSVEAAALANGLAVIALARELDRIDKLEADAKERAERIRQLRLERERLAAEKRASDQRDSQDPPATGGTSTAPLPQQAPLAPPLPQVLPQTHPVPVPMPPRSEAPAIVSPFAGGAATAFGEGEGEPFEQRSLSSHGVRPPVAARVQNAPAAGLAATPVGQGASQGLPQGLSQGLLQGGLPMPRSSMPLDIRPPGSGAAR